MWFPSEQRMWCYFGLVVVYKAMQLCYSYCLRTQSVLKQDVLRVHYLSPGIDLYIGQSAVCGGNIQTSTAADSPYYLVTHHLVSEEDPGRCKALPDRTRRSHDAAVRSQNATGCWNKSTGPTNWTLLFPVCNRHLSNWTLWVCHSSGHRKKAQSGSALSRQPLLCAWRTLGAASWMCSWLNWDGA